MGNVPSKTKQLSQKLFSGGMHTALRRGREDTSALWYVLDVTEVAFSASLMMDSSHLM